MSRKGFTLIELLVVIAIIAILAAILFPVFARARAKAMQTACLSNVKELALACNSYTTDYDGRYPPMEFRGSWQYASPSMECILSPYIKNDQIWTCPSLPGNEIQDYATYHNTALTSGYLSLFYDYMWNDWNGGEFWDTSYGWASVSQAKVTQSSTCIMLGDGFSDWWGEAVFNYGIGVNPDAGLTAQVPYWPTNLGDGSTLASFGPVTPWAGWQARHDGMCNFAFIDGHAKAMSLNVLAGAGHVTYLDATSKCLWNGYYSSY